MHPEEKKYMSTISDIEKKIIEKNKKEEKKKINKYNNIDFSWWKYNDNDTYFAMSTKRKHTF
jgi:hypothetical protein